MRSSSNALAATVGLTTWKRAQSARARIIPFVSMLVLGLSGTGPCLCASEPVPSAADPHACCADVKTDVNTEDSGRSTARASVKRCSPACPGTHGALALAVPANGIDQLNALPVADARTTSPPVAPDMRAALLAFGASQRRSPPLRTTVLRI